MILILLITLILSLAFNMFMIGATRGRTRNFNKQIQIMIVKQRIVQEKYDAMINFLDSIIKNPRYTAAFLEFDPIISEILNKIKDFHNTLVNLYDADPSLYYREENLPDEIDEGNNER